MFRFVHAADLHLDTPFTGLAELWPELAEECVQASLTAFSRLVDHTLAVGADALFLAGGLYDGPERGVRGQVALLDGLRRLSEGGVQTFVVAGDRELADAWRGAGPLPERVTLFGPDGPATAPIRRGQETVALVHGVCRGSGTAAEAVARIRRQPSSRFQIGLLHAPVADGTGPADDAGCTVADLAATGLDYWALGHAHRHQVLREQDPWVVVPGTLQGRRPEEAGPCGAVVGLVDDGGLAHLTFTALDAVRFARTTVEVAGGADLASWHGQLAAEGRRQLAQADGRPVILQARIAAHPDAAAALDWPAVLAELLAALREEGLSETPVVWWERLDLMPRPAPAGHRIGRQEGPNLAAVLARRAGALAADGARLASVMEELRGPVPPSLYPLAPPPEEWPALVEAAASEMIAALEEDGR